MRDSIPTQATLCHHCQKPIVWNQTYPDKANSYWAHAITVGKGKSHTLGNALMEQQCADKRHWATPARSVSIMNDTTTEKLSSAAAFVAKHKIGMHAVAVTENPNMQSAQPMRHWLCKFNQPGRGKMQVYFSMGMGLKGKPLAADVLDCLAMDATGVDGQSFEDWCAEYGYDDDSRKAEQTYKVCKEQAEELRRFLGEQAFNELLWNTERM